MKQKERDLKMILEVYSKILKLTLANSKRHNRWLLTVLGLICLLIYFSPTQGIAASLLDITAVEMPSLIGLKSEKLSVYKLHLGMLRPDAERILRDSKKLIGIADDRNSTRIYVYEKLPNGGKGKNVFNLIWKTDKPGLQRIVVFPAFSSYLTHNFRRLLTFEAVDNTSENKNKFVGYPSRSKMTLDLPGMVKDFQSNLSGAVNMNNLERRQIDEILSGLEGSLDKAKNIYIEYRKGLTKILGSSLRVSPQDMDDIASRMKELAYSAADNIENIREPLDEEIQFYPLLKEIVVAQVKAEIAKRALNRKLEEIKKTQLENFLGAWKEALTNPELNIDEDVLSQYIETLNIIERRIKRGENMSIVLSQIDTMHITYYFDEIGLEIIHRHHGKDDSVNFAIVKESKDGGEELASSRDMVLIPAGEFMMGCNESVDNQCQGDDEKPYHRVYLDAYYIVKYEVTVDQYAQCVKAGKCLSYHLTGFEWTGQSFTEDEHCNWGKSYKDNHPVNCVDWSQASGYCEWAGGRLPTEAEWEKAARGTDGRKYPWGNENANCDYAVMINQEVSGCGRDNTWPVGSKPAGASPYGVMDMAGNVYEWVQDWYDGNYYKNSPSQNPQGPTSGSYRVLRGGSWQNAQDLLRSSLRVNQFSTPLPHSYIFYTVPSSRYEHVGFRCARQAK